jgi:hypothetical protein
LGGESFGEKNEFVGLVELPSPISASLGVGLGSVTANLLTNYVTNMWFPDATMREMKKTVIQSGLAAGGSVASLYYGSGISPLMNGAILGVGFYVGGEFLSNKDQALLGHLF